MNELGFHLSMSGCSEAALECCRTIGISGHPETIKDFRKNLGKDNPKLLSVQPELADQKVPIKSLYLGVDAPLLPCSKAQNDGNFCGLLSR